MLNTSVVGLKSSSSSSESLSSNFTQFKFEVNAFLQKNLSSNKLAKALTEIPMFPEALFGVA